MKRFLVYGLSNDWGGVEAIVLTMVSHLCDNYLFDILLSEDMCAYERKFISGNVRFLHIPAWGSSRKGFRKGLATILSACNYDYLWINACLMSNRDIISVTRKYSKARIITHSHGSSFEEPNVIKRFVLKSLHYANRNYYHKNVDIPCMCSYKSGIWYYGKRFMKTHDVYLIKNGVDSDRFKFDNKVRIEYRRNLGLKDGEIALFHAGRLTQVKNQSFLIDVLSVLKKRGVNSKLLIAGDGELKMNIKHYTEELHLNSDVIFLGNRNDVDKLYQAMDVFLLPSFHEGFPVTLAEAQISGLFCIASEYVSKETNISGQMKFLPIGGKSAQVWADNVLYCNFDINNRVERGKVAINQGFDITDVCHHFKERIMRN